MYLCNPAIAVALAVMWLVLDKPALALTLGLFGLSGLIQALSVRANYDTGYFRGRNATMSAIAQAESPEEFVRLTQATPPGPWER